MRALVIGGTGPTGPHVLAGLIERGYEPTIFHRGVHEPSDLPDVRHIHGDPHFVETVQDAIGDEEFDVVVCMYGRLRHVATALEGRCEQFVAVSGVPVYQNFVDPEIFYPYGMKILTRESDPIADSPGAPQFSALIAASERRVLELRSSGAFKASILRYPTIYGPRSIVPVEWSVMKRIMDGREFMILPDGGIGIHARCAAANAAQALLSLIDHPDVADGEIYNIADDDQYTWRQWTELIARAMDGSIQIMGLPRVLSENVLTELVFMPNVSAHTMVDTTKIRDQLGYQQVVPAHQAMEETIRHLLQNPVDLAEYPAFRDEFDYEAEDRLVSAYTAAITDVVKGAGRPPVDFMHPMPHPKQPGDVGRDERGR